MTTRARRGVCRACGCTDDDCRGCIQRTGEPCSWAEPDLCTACVDQPEDARRPKKRRGSALGGLFALMAAFAPEAMDLLTSPPRTIEERLRERVGRLEAELAQLRSRLRARERRAYARGLRRGARAYYAEHTRLTRRGRVPRCEQARYWIEMDLAAHCRAGSLGPYNPPEVRKAMRKSSWSCVQRAAALRANCLYGPPLRLPR